MSGIAVMKGDSCDKWVLRSNAKGTQGWKLRGSVVQTQGPEFGPPILHMKTKARHGFTCLQYNGVESGGSLRPIG